MTIPTLKQALACARAPWIGAHRGASILFPENSMAAFQAAINCGADFLELDVRLTKDGVPIVIHDESIDRTTSASGLVKDLTYSKIRKAGPIPSLLEVLTSYGNQVFLNIELKTSHDTQFLVNEVLNLLFEYGLVERVFLSSFDHSLLRQIRLQNTDVFIGLLYEEPGLDILACAGELGTNAIHPYYRLVSRTLASDCHKAGLKLFPWTVDTAWPLRYLAAVGATGIITNKPDYAANLLPNCIKYQ